MYVNSVYYTILYTILLSLHSGVNCNPTGDPGGSSPAPQIVELDLAQKEDVTGIKYERDDQNDRDRYTAQEGYLINKVVKGSRSIFEITNEKYIDRVIVYKDSAGQRKLKFLTPGENETYGEVDTHSQSQSQPQQPQDVQDQQVQPQEDQDQQVQDQDVQEDQEQPKEDQEQQEQPKEDQEQQEQPQEDQELQEQPQVQPNVQVYQLHQGQPLQAPLQLPQQHHQPQSVRPQVLQHQHPAVPPHGTQIQQPTQIQPTVDPNMYYQPRQQVLNAVDPNMIAFQTGQQVPTTVAPNMMASQPGYQAPITVAPNMMDSDTGQHVAYGMAPNMMAYHTGYQTQTTVLPRQSLISHPGSRVAASVAPSVMMPTQPGQQVATAVAHRPMAPTHQAHQVHMAGSPTPAMPFHSSQQIPPARVAMPAMPHQSSHQVQTTVVHRPRLPSQSTQHVPTATARRPRIPTKPQAQQMPQATSISQPIPAVPGQVQYIELNVKHMASTKYVDYYHYPTEDVHRFICKTGFLVGKLKKDTRLIHEYKQDHPDRVIIFWDQNGKQSIAGLAPGTTHTSEPTYLPPQAQALAQQPTAPAPKAQPLQIPLGPDEPEQLPVQPKLKPGEIQLIELELNNRQTTDQILYEVNEESEYERYTCMPGYLINKILKNGQVVRVPENNDLFNRAVVSGSKGQRKLGALLPGDIDKTCLIFELELTNKQSTDEYIYKTNAENTREKFTCKSGFLISKVLKRGNPVAQPESGDYFDRAIIYTDDQGKKQLKTLFPGDNDDGDSDEPTAMHTIAASMKGTFDQDFLAGAGIELLTQDRIDGTAGPESTKSQQAPPAPKTPIKLDLSKLLSTRTYKYEKSGNINTFIAERDFGFYTVRLDHNSLWETDDVNNLARRVDFSTNSFTKSSEIRIELYDGSEKRLVKGENEAWKEAPSIKLNPVSVNLRTLTSNDMYESSSEGNFRHFMAKSGWAFNKVIESGWYFACNANVDAPPIWEAEDRNEYAVKIIRDGASLLNSITEMTIYLINGEEKKFKKSGDNWIQWNYSKPSTNDV